MSEESATTTQNLEKLVELAKIVRQACEFYVKETNGLEDLGGLCYNLRVAGWNYNGTLIREWVNKITNPVDIIDLKKLNTQAGSTICAKCGSQLKDPGMGPVYKHCPICEP